MSSIAVYCSSSNHVSNIYKKEAKKLGSLLAKHKIKLVYGGGNMGLMGILANSVLDNGGNVFGVITEHLIDVEKKDISLNNLKIVKTMHERKMEMFMQADCFIIFPGGIGTLEEFFEEYKRMRDSSETQFKDDYIKSAVEYYNANGNLTPYLEATALKYEDMSDEQIMRRNLEKANPTLSKRAIERLYQKDVIDKYTLDEDKYDEDEVELGKELLQAEATKLRKQYVDEQKNFTQPPKTEGEETESQEKIIQQWTETVSNNAITKSVLENKSILVEYGDSKFSYEVENPQDLQDMTIDNNKFFALFKDENDNIDFDKWYKVLAYAINPEVYDSSLISHGQEMGQEKLVSNMKNTEKPVKSSKEYKAPSNHIEGIIGALSRGDSDIKIIR